MADLNPGIIDWNVAPAGLDGIAADLTVMREHAGSPSYREIVRRIGEARAAAGSADAAQAIARSTVYDCFRTGRTRIDIGVAGEIAAALGLPADMLPAWTSRVRSARSATDAAAVVTGYAQAPRVVDVFVDRDAVLASAEDALAQHPIWLAGLGGAGKTQLALRLVERAGGSGAFVDLRGFSTDAPAVNPQVAQRAILRMLASNAQGTDAVTAALRASGSLLVLDDAADLDQVAQVVGETPPPGVIVTSRVRPPDGAVGWRVIDVAGLTEAETADLLGRFAGSTVAESEAARLTEATEGLPLAISLVAGRLRTHPDWTLAEHVDFAAARLSDGRLDSELSTALEASYRDLGDPASRALRAFADVPVESMTASSTAALLGVPDAVAETAVAELVAHSLAVRRDEAFVLHTLVRAFAHDRALETDPPSARDAAFARLGEYFADFAWVSYDALQLAWAGKRADRSAKVPHPDLTWTTAEAEAWLELHHRAMLRMAHAAPDRGRPDILIRISEGMSQWLYVQGHRDVAAALHEHAADVAMAEDRPGDAIRATMALCRALAQTFRADEVAPIVDRAVAFAEAAGLDEPVTIGILLSLAAGAESQLGNYRSSIATFRRALDVLEPTGKAPLELSAITALAGTLREVGEFDEAERLYLRGVELGRQTSYTMMTANCRTSLLSVRVGQGQYERVLSEADEVLAEAEELNLLMLVAYGQESAAEAHSRRGEHAQARERIDRAVTAARELGEPAVLAEALLGDAEVAVSAGDRVQAEAAVTEAEALIPENGEPLLLGRADLVRGDLAGDPAERETRWRRALERFETTESFWVRFARERLDGAVTPPVRS